MNPPRPASPTAIAAMAIQIHAGMPDDPPVVPTATPLTFDDGDADGDAGGAR